ncbi:unnamed protein product, partial [Adineta steineri]
DKFRNLEQPKTQTPRPLAIVPGVDVDSFIAPKTQTKEGQDTEEEERAPRVMVPLRDTSAEQSMPVLLTATIDAGSPMATFTWLKNGQPLVEGDRYTTTYDMKPKTVTLEILDAKPTDQGTYTLRATNPFGNDETTAKLAIRPASSPDALPTATPKPVEIKAPVPTKQEMQQVQAPKVTVPLENVEATKGSPVLLRATIVGTPTPNFVWLKNGQPLMTSNRLRPRYDAPTKQVVLQITDVHPEDAGQYVIVATNPAGQDSTGTTLTIADDRPKVPTDNNRIKNKPEGEAPRPLKVVPGVEHQPSLAAPAAEEQRAPRVIVPLSDNVVEETMPVIFRSTIDIGSPIGTFTWLKDGKPLVEGDRYITTYDIKPKILTLEILDAKPSDQGTYTVRAANPLGNDETTAKLVVQPASSPDALPSSTPKPVEVKAPVPTKQEMQQVQPPKVIVPLENVEATKGSPVLLRATIAGTPTPNFVWLKDGQPLMTSNRIRTKYDAPTKQVVLQITDVRPEDVGQYVVVAKNPAGQDSTGTTLTIADDRPKAPTDNNRIKNQPEGEAPRPLNVVPGVEHQPSLAAPAAEEQRAPRVIVPLSDNVVEESMPVIFRSTIDIGSPIGTFTWLKDGKPLVEGDRYITTYDMKPKILTLEILDAKPSDQGTYTVRAANPLGTDETTAKLAVRPATSPDALPSSTPKPVEVKASVPTKQEMQQVQPPKVIVPLENVEAIKGSPVLLRATIAGTPTPNFVWLKDGQPLMTSNRIRTKYDAPTKQVVLQITDVRPEDVGQYVVVAKNPAGQDSTGTTLTIADDRPKAPTDNNRIKNQPEGEAPRPLNVVPGVEHQPSTTSPAEEQRAPRVITPLTDNVVEESMPVVFRSTIDIGSPIGTFTWLKDGKPLVEGDRYITTYDIKPKILTLEILDAKPSDQGTYTVRAANPLGSDETTAKLAVRPATSPDALPSSTPKPVEVKAPVPTKQEMQQVQPPKVIVPLENVEATKGSPVLLRATIAGTPTPN